MAGVRGPQYACGSCGALAPKWTGQCATCRAWNTVSELPAVRSAPSVVTRLGDADLEDGPLCPTDIPELDRVLGGGLVAGSTTLLFGEPGVGKSTLALAVLSNLARASRDVLLVASEESAGQVARRARRVGAAAGDIGIVATTEAAVAEDSIHRTRPALVVVDSVSALRDDSVSGSAGSPSQVRAIAERLCQAAKRTGSPLVLVGHVTKDGELAGPRALEHLVDTVVRVEGDRHGTLRVVRALKHRFGPTGEVGLFDLTDQGLVELPDAGVPASDLAVPGVVWGAASDGSRALAVELQVLVATAASAAPRRVAHQLSAQRLALMLAVLEARCGWDLRGLDVFAASAGGLPAGEPGVDAALALALASAAGGFVVPRDVAVVGEVGLAGELRAVGGIGRRVSELRRRGVTTVYVPAADVTDDAGVRMVGVRRLPDLLADFAPDANRPASGRMVSPH